MNLVKSQIPLNSYGNTVILFSFVEQQSEFAFFGALTSVGALFYLYESLRVKEMEKQKKTEFEEACKAYLFPLSITDLRVYGRYLGLPAPTKLKKAELICEIIQVLCGEKTAVRTNKGAHIGRRKGEGKQGRKRRKERKCYAVAALHHHREFDERAKATFATTFKQFVI